MCKGKDVCSNGPRKELTASAEPHFCEKKGTVLVLVSIKNWAPESNAVVLEESEADRLRWRSALVLSRVAVTCWPMYPLLLLFSTIHTRNLKVRVIGCTASEARSIDQ